MTKEVLNEYEATENLVNHLEGELYRLDIDRKSTAANKLVPGLENAIKSYFEYWKVPETILDTYGSAFYFGIAKGFFESALKVAKDIRGIAAAEFVREMEKAKGYIEHLQNAKKIYAEIQEEIEDGE